MLFCHICTFASRPYRYKQQHSLMAEGELKTIELAVQLPASAASCPIVAVHNAGLQRIQYSGCKRRLTIFSFMLCFSPVSTFALV